MAGFDVAPTIKEALFWREGRIQDGAIPLRQVAQLHILNDKDDSQSRQMAFRPDLRTIDFLFLLFLSHYHVHDGQSALPYSLCRLRNRAPLPQKKTAAVTASPKQ